MVITTNHPLLPPELWAMAGNISRGFGVDLDTAALLMLEALAFASGNSTLIKTPEGRTLRPAFDLALISDGAGFLRGAVATLTSPIMDFVLRACEEECGRGVEAVRNALEAKATALHEIRQRVAKNERALGKVKTKNAKAENLVERLSHGGQMMPGEFAEVRATNYNFADQDGLEKNLASDRQNLPGVEAELQMLQLAAAPGILVDEPDWKSLPDLSQGSFDQLTMALSFSGVRQL